MAAMAISEEMRRELNQSSSCPLSNANCRAAIQTAFGYPSAPPYSGRRLDYCAGSLIPDPYGSADAGINCTMTEGGSGGPWFSGFDPRTGRGTITGVTTFRYAGDSLALYSANLGATAKALYEQAQRVKS